MRLTETGREGRLVIAHWFDGLDDLLAYVEMRPAGSLAERDRLTKTTDGDHDSSWFGTESFAAAMDLARYGWPEGQVIVDAITAKLDGIIGSKIMRPQMAHAVAGDCVDIGRFVTGEPENMMQWEEVESEGIGKIVRVEVNLSASCGVTAEEIALRGAAACALVDALENSGKSVELMATSGWDCYSRGAFLEYFIPVKTAGEPVEMDRLAFILAHPSMLRRFLFAASENAPAMARGRNVVKNGGYGCPCKTQAGEFSADIIVPELRLISTTDAALKWVFTTLREQGITFSQNT